MYKHNLCGLHYNINMVETRAPHSWLQGLHNPRLLWLYANAITKDKLKINVSSLKNQSAINLKARGSACIFLNISDTNKRMRSDSATQQSRVEPSSHAARLNTLIVEVLWDEAVHFLPVLWQLEQRSDNQEDASFLMLLRQDLERT